MKRIFEKLFQGNNNLLFAVALIVAGNYFNNRQLRQTGFEIMTQPRQVQVPVEITVPKQETAPVNVSVPKPQVQIIRQELPSIPKPMQEPVARAAQVDKPGKRFRPFAKIFGGRKGRESPLTSPSLFP